MRYSKRFNILAHIVMITSILFISFPVIYALIVSTHTFQDSFAFPPRFSIGSHFINNYAQAWKNVNMGRLLLNTTGISIAVSIGKIALALLAAFAFTYFGNFRGKYFLFFLILITHMLPLPIRIVPTYQLMEDFGWVNTYYALTLPFFASATGTLLFRQFFLTVPTDLSDAARMDGAGAIKFFCRILVPLSRTNITALFMIEFIFMWNQYLWPLIVTNSNEMRVVQIGLKMLLAGEQQAPQWNVIMAGMVITIVPPLIILFLLQSSFVKGFAMREEK